MPCFSRGRARPHALLAFLFFLGACGDDAAPPEGWQPAFDGTDVGWLLNVGGASADDLYVVGGSPDRGVMMHYDGASWAEVSLPDGVPLLNWVHAFAADDIYAVGNGGLVLHYDGSGWVESSVGLDRNLWGVWGASPNDLWAVGGNGLEDGQATIVHYDGSAWTVMEPPPLERPSVFAWFKVWGTATDDVWFVGQRGAVVHWDGSTLTEHLVGVSDDLISLWGTGPDEVVIVGGRSNGVVALWDGSSWQSQSLAPLPGLNGVWMRESNVVHVVGVEGTAGVLDLSTFEVEEESTDTRLDLHAVFSVDGAPLVSVGGSLSSPVAPFQGVALTRPLRVGE